MITELNQIAVYIVIYILIWRYCSVECNLIILIREISQKGILNKTSSPFFYDDEF